MNERISAVLVHDRAEHLNDLKRILEEYFPVEIKTARTCGEAIREIKKGNPPHLIFTDVTLPDGTWAELLEQVTTAAVPADVIVVSRDVDIRLYLEALEHGAFDFVAAPFYEMDVAWIVARATEDVMKRRGLPCGTVSAA